MRHNKKFNHLSRTASHRASMLANMAVSLIKHKRITTTVAKAKALKKYVEPLITKSKQDTTNSRRVVFSYLKDKYAVTELFKEVSVKVADRPGGYTASSRPVSAPAMPPRCASSSWLITTSTWPKPKRRPSALVVPRRPLPLPKLKPAKPPLQKRRKLQKLQNNSATYLFPIPAPARSGDFFVSFLLSLSPLRTFLSHVRSFPVPFRFVVMSEKVCKILLRPPLRLGVPQAGGEFVMLTFICRFT